AEFRAVRAASAVAVPDLLCPAGDRGSVLLRGVSRSAGLPLTVMYRAVRADLRHRVEPVRFRKFGVGVRQQPAFSERARDNSGAARGNAGDSARAAFARQFVAAGYPGVDSGVGALDPRIGGLGGCRPGPPRGLAPADPPSSERPTGV